MKARRRSMHPRCGPPRLPKMSSRRGSTAASVEIDKRAYVLRVSAHRPPVQRSFADVASGIRESCPPRPPRIARARLSAEATERVKKGEGSATVAAAYGLEWQSTAASRATSTLDHEIIQAAFGLPRPTDDIRSVTSTELGGGRIAVVTVTAVTMTATMLR